MTVLSTLPTPVVQMGFVEKIVEVAQNQPQVQQQVAQEAAVQTLREQQQRVSGVDAAKHGKKVREREAGGGSRQRADPDWRHEAPHETLPEDPTSDSGPRKTNPWTGHIINLKI